MENQLNHLQHLVDKGIINLDDFYCVTIWDTEIKLQGKSTSDKVKGYSGIFKFEVDQENNFGFLNGESKIHGINVSITLTT